MTRDLSFYDDVEALERYIGVPPGALKNIPIYGRVGAVNAIIKVREMEKISLFRQGLYYIVLADLRGNTAFNAKWGDRAGDVRVEWFQTCAIEALGEIEPKNYAAYLKAIGDAALLIFSSFVDVAAWSSKFTSNLASMSDEYNEACLNDDEGRDEEIEDFAMKARRLVHLGEVRFKDASDPICLAVSQTFKIEKVFDLDELGCTEAVIAAVRSVLPDLGLVPKLNKPVTLPGDNKESNTYYLTKK